MVNTQGCLFILAKMYLGELNYMWMSAMGMEMAVETAVEMEMGLGKVTNRGSHPQHYSEKEKVK